MSNLWELTGSRLALQRKLEVLNFDEDTVLDTLEANSTELAEKVTDYGYVLRNRASFADSMTAEIERMTVRRDAELKRIAAIEKWLLDSMIACNFLKVEAPAFTIAVQNNPPKVIVDDESQIPKEFWRQPTIPLLVIDKTAISKAIKSGEIVDGAHLESTQRLSIK